MRVSFITGREWRIEINIYVTDQRMYAVKQARIYSLQSRRTVIDVCRQKIQYPAYGRMLR
ncbi:hypothetical protein EAH74_32260 [Pseudomonas mandelii]|uniref:Uncharacterized protein n=1 Tax=Pseudomonas mandelii TaxID=75612 RepID=A0A502HK28_9PSED|nr:hypothetical protein EAH74_32260 [Pseudomonas mandelii]